MHETLDFQHHLKSGILVYTYNLETWEVEAGGSQVQGHSWLQISLRSTQLYILTHFFCPLESKHRVTQISDLGQTNVWEGYWYICTSCDETHSIWVQQGSAWLMLPLTGTLGKLG